MNIPRILTPLVLIQSLIAMTQAVTFNLAGDWLAGETGVEGIPNGSLIILIASTVDGEFAPPAESSLVDPESDDVILGSFFASDDNGRFNRGSYSATIQVNFGDETLGLDDFDGGDPLMIRWFPTLGPANSTAKLTGLIPYGEFRADEVLLGSNAPWVTPGSNAAIINLSIVADVIGNRYDPQGTIPVSQLAATQVFERAIFEAARAQISISAMANGFLSISWPLLDGATAPLGRLQQSADLVHWTDVTEEIDLSEDGVASTVTRADGPAQFYRLSSEE